MIVAQDRYGLVLWPLHELAMLRQATWVASLGLEPHRLLYVLDHDVRVAGPPLGDVAFHPGLLLVRVEPEVLRHNPHARSCWRARERACSRILASLAPGRSAWRPSCYRSEGRSVMTLVLEHRGCSGPS